MPIFQGGRLLSNYYASKAAWEQAVREYEAAVVNAFAEVSNALVSRDKLREIRAQKERQVAALQEAVEVSLKRYSAGDSTYFEVLEAQQQLFPAQNELARAMRDQLIVVVLLYRALGGGWAVDAEGWAPDVFPAAAARSEGDVRKQMIAASSLASSAASEGLCEARGGSAP
jgi:multidrug efflux system outer membrane protein